MMGALERVLTNRGVEMACPKPGPPRMSTDTPCCRPAITSCRADTESCATNRLFLAAGTPCPEADMPCPPTDMPCPPTDMASSRARMALLNSEIAKIRRFSTNLVPYEVLPYGINGRCGISCHARVPGVESGRSSVVIRSSGGSHFPTSASLTGRAFSLSASDSH